MSASAHHVVPPPPELAAVLAPGDVELSTGDITYRGVDVDGDGRDDSVKSLCGAGVDQLCTLSVSLSSGAAYTATDLAPFYLVRLNGRIVLVNDGLVRRGEQTMSSPPTFQILSRHQLQPPTRCARPLPPANQPKSSRRDGAT